MTLREEVLNLCEEKNIMDIFDNLFDKYSEKYARRNKLKNVEWWDFFDSDSEEVEQWEKRCEAIAKKKNKTKEWEEYYKELCDEL